MIRAYLYLSAAGAIWLIEGFLFSRFLGLAAWQVALLAVAYVGLFAIALRYFLRALREAAEGPRGVAAWRMLAYAPALVVIVGSFVSLPLILVVVALGKLS